MSHELDETNAVKAVYHNEPQQYGGVLSQRSGTTSHYHHHDALGSTRFLTDNSGNVTDTYLHDAWGNLVESTGTTVNPFKWVGKYGYYQDASTGLVYVRARMYQPTVARWYSVDPLAKTYPTFVRGCFQYSSNAPVYMLDVSGFISVSLDPKTRLWDCNKSPKGTGVNSTFYVYWDMQLDNPAPFEGYIVQHIIIAYQEKLCHNWLLDDCYCDWKLTTRNETEIELWEAFFVEKGNKAPYPPLGRDIWHKDPSSFFEECGMTTFIGEARFFAGTTTGYLKEIWKDKNQYGASFDGSTDEKPIWWDTDWIEKERPIINGAGSYRDVIHEFCCCSPPSLCGGKTFARLRASAREQSTPYVNIEY